MSLEAQDAPPIAPDLSEEFGAASAPLCPNRTDIEVHLYALFSTTFVHLYPDAQIEIAFADMKGSQRPDAAKQFSAFRLEEAADFAAEKNAAGFNVYVGASLKKAGTKGRSGKGDTLTAAYAWADSDEMGGVERINKALAENRLQTGIVVVTGSKPHLRIHTYVKLDGKVTPDELENANVALKTLFGSDDVADHSRLMRLAGTINYPTADKIERGYVAELVALHLNKDAPAYTVEHLTGLVGTKRSGLGFDFNTKKGRTDDEIIALLGASRVPGQWHNSMRAAIATMVGRGWSDTAIKLACAPYCRGGADDPDLAPLIEGAREKWNRPDEEPVEPGANSDTDVERLNKTHAVLPIGGKTRVVTFGELPEFPGRKTIVMTQTIDDFRSLKNKYRHTYRDDKGNEKSVPLGTYWIGSPKRLQFDGGMQFTPQHDGDVGNKLNLWRGFGVTAVKPDGTSGAAGCQKFLDFMRTIICSGNEEHFDYLRKREATIFQKRIRSEIALGLRTKEEGCGKGFYEATMGRLLGDHAMQVTNPKHIVGSFNPHLETLLRLTADEALFVGNAEHRNALFGLITEPTLTIEPKGCGLYKADSYLNLSITSNADHFLPVSGTARRFFIPTVSAERKQNFTYFAGLKAELEGGGYEALLYHLLHEVDLTDFNVRMVPQTEALRQQRDYSFPPLEAWWVELLESGTLMGADPDEPHRAVSNSHQREIKIEDKSGYGGTTTQTRYVTQRGIYDQARLIEPRLRAYTNDYRLGRFLSEMGCGNTIKVLRRQGWTFPPLAECREAWVKRYPGWEWRNPGITEWSAEEDDDAS